MYLRTLVFFFFLIISHGIKAQSATPGGSVRIMVFSGGNLDFVFNSIAKYKNGITYTNWTTLGISVTDSAAAPDYQTWEVSVEAMDSDGDGAITGSNPANTIPFASIEIGASAGLGCATCNFIFPGPPYLALPAPGAGVAIVDGGPADAIPPNLVFTNDQILITYRCGVTTSLLGSVADYYSDDIVFTLQMDP